MCKISVKDDSRDKVRLLERKVAGERRLVEDRDNPFGEYYVIDRSGGLQNYDREGLVFTYPSVKE